MLPGVTELLLPLHVCADGGAKSKEFCWELSDASLSCERVCFEAKAEVFIFIIDYPKYLNISMSLSTNKIS